MIKSTILYELNRNRLVQVVSIFFIIMSVWWVTLYLRDLKDNTENNYFTLLYPILSLIGGVSGIILSKKWGSFKSYLGGALSYFSLGLLAQFMGQATYAYYIYILGIKVPYPSLGDIGFFGSVILYTIGVIYLSKASGVKISLKSSINKIQAIIFPLAMLSISYFIFLKDYVIDSSQISKIILDFGYPLGQAFYVSIAILTLILSRKMLGGIMKKPISFFLVSLIVQYLCDFTFLYQSNHKTWYVGGINDYMYLVSYFLMTAALIYMNVVFKRIQKS